MSQRLNYNISNERFFSLLISYFKFAFFSTMSAIALSLLATFIYFVVPFATEDAKADTFVFDFDDTLYSIKHDKEDDSIIQFSETESYDFGSNYLYYIVKYSNDDNKAAFRKALKGMLDYASSAFTNKDDALIAYSKFTSSHTKRNMRSVAKLVEENITAGMGEELKRLTDEGNKVIIIGGSVFGCAIIPMVMEQYGVKKENIYSGYFNGYKSNDLSRAITNHGFVNCAEPNNKDLSTESMHKQDVIEQLRKNNKIEGRLIHTGDGMNDLVLYTSGTVPMFIGFGVNRISPPVQKMAPVFVTTVEEYKVATKTILAIDNPKPANIDSIMAMLTSSDAKDESSETAAKNTAEKAKKGKGKRKKDLGTAVTPSEDATKAKTDADASNTAKDIVATPENIAEAMHAAKQAKPVDVEEDVAAIDAQALANESKPTGKPISESRDESNEESNGESNGDTENATVKDIADASTDTAPNEALNVSSNNEEPETEVVIFESKTIVGDASQDDQANEQSFFGKIKKMFK